MKDDKKVEGPTCVCGSVDLYEEMLKQQDSSKMDSVNKTNKSDISTIDLSKIKKVTESKEHLQIQKK